MFSYIRASKHKQKLGKKASKQASSQHAQGGWPPRTPLLEGRPSIWSDFDL